MTRPSIPCLNRPVSLTLLALLTGLMSSCATIPDPVQESGGLGSNLGALRAVIPLSLQGLANQAALVNKLTGVPAVPAAGGAPATPAVPGLSQILTPVAALPAATNAYAPNVRYRTAAPPVAAATPACSQVGVNAVGAVPNPVLPTTKQKVLLMFNDASLYLEGFVRGDQYFYFMDTLQCARLWPVAKSTKLTYKTTHLSSSYSSDLNSVSGAVDVLSQTGSTGPDVQKALDQLSFVTSEALRFSTVMAAVSAGGQIGKDLYPEVNRWSNASVVYAALVANNALPAPAPTAEVLTALHALSTAQQ